MLTYTNTDSDLAVGKRLVRRLVEEVVNAGDLSVLDEIYTAPMARAARRWIEPFRASFPDFEMNIVQLVAEGDTVVARFRCSGTHRGEWLGTHRPGGGSSASTRSTSSRSATPGSRAPGASRTRCRAAGQLGLAT